MAALTVADTGLGATISGTGLITAQVVSIGEMTISVDSLDITHLGTAGFEALRPSDLRKNPEVDIVLLQWGRDLEVAESRPFPLRGVRGVLKVTNQNPKQNPKP